VGLFFYNGKNSLFNLDVYGLKTLKLCTRKTFQLTSHQKCCFTPEDEEKEKGLTPLGGCSSSKHFKILLSSFFFFWGGCLFMKMILTVKDLFMKLMHP
jgi:hypothetical protein